MTPQREKQELEFKLAMTAEVAVRKWGMVAQQVKAIEECGELIVVLSKHLNIVDPRRQVTTFEIIDEIADVTIMLAQLRVIHGHAIIDTRINQKLDRLKPLIEKGPNEL